jgi:hypothetical protein
VKSLVKQFADLARNDPLAMSELYEELGEERFAFCLSYVGVRYDPCALGKIQIAIDELKDRLDDIDNAAGCVPLDREAMRLRRLEYFADQVEMALDA